MITLRHVRFASHVFPLRRPFRFGIVELNSLEHLVVAADFDIDGEPVTGEAGENLAPRWFVKDASRTIDDEVAMMKRAIAAVCDIAIALPGAATPFDLWWQLHRAVRDGGVVEPPLLAQLAESLVERAALDAWCRFHKTGFADLMRADRLGFRPEVVHRTLKPAAFAPAATSLLVRHTVGLADALEELPGLLRGVGIHRLKVKLGGDPAGDVDRLHDVFRVCEVDGWAIDRITLDGNENYAQVAAFEAFIGRLQDGPVRDVAARVVWIEQPFHREIALGDEVREMLGRLECPPMVIDESDASPADLPRALEAGYAGTTHKNCKGVFKSMLHGLLLREHASRTGRPTVFSGEDLTIVAPWSQASDLIVAAAVGVIDIERNGHHYADGLSGFDAKVGDEALAKYPNLYRRRDDGVVELRIVSGRIEGIGAGSYR